MAAPQVAFVPGAPFFAARPPAAVLQPGKRIRHRQGHRPYRPRCSRSTCRLIISPRTKKQPISNDHFSLDGAGTPTSAGIFVDPSAIPPVESLPGLKFQPTLGELTLANYVTFEPHTEAPMHVHLEEQVVIVVDGQFDFTIDDQTKTMRVGDVAVIPPWVPHGAKTHEHGCREIDVFSPPRATLLNLARGGDTAAEPAQVTNFIDAAAHTLGGLDILVNNAGDARPGNFETLSDEDWQHDLDVKLFSQFRCVRAALPHLRRSSSTWIINVNAVYAKYPDPAFFATTVNWAACPNLNKALAAEFGTETSWSTA